MPSTMTSDIDLFLPTAAPLEHQSHYLNILGLVRSTRVVLSPLKTTYTDPQIVRFLYKFAYRFFLMHRKNIILSVMALRV